MLLQAEQPILCCCREGGVFDVFKAPSHYNNSTRWAACLQGGLLSCAVAREQRQQFDQNRKSFGASQPAGLCLHVRMCVRVGVTLSVFC